MDGTGALAVDAEVTMPTEKKFKRAVRARVKKTGESYAAARSALHEDEGIVVDRSEPGSTWVEVPRLWPEGAVPAAIQALVCPPEAARPAIARACARLAANVKAQAVLCWDGRCAELLFAAAGDAALREQARAFLRTPHPWLMRAIDYLGPLGFGAGPLLCLRRIEHSVQLAVLFTAEDAPPELVRMRVGHAALAIERALEAARR